MTLHNYIDSSHAKAHGDTSLSQYNDRSRPHLLTPSHAPVCLTYCCQQGTWPHPSCRIEQRDAGVSTPGSLSLSAWHPSYDCPSPVQRMVQVMLKHWCSLVLHCLVLVLYIVVGANHIGALGSEMFVHSNHHTVDDLSHIVSLRDAMYDIVYNHRPSLYISKFSEN